MTFAVGDRVEVATPQGWLPGVVVELRDIADLDRRLGYKTGYCPIEVQLDVALPGASDRWLTHPRSDQIRRV